MLLGRGGKGYEYRRWSVVSMTTTPANKHMEQRKQARTYKQNSHLQSFK